MVELNFEMNVKGEDHAMENGAPSLSRLDLDQLMHSSHTMPLEEVFKKCRIATVNQSDYEQCGLTEEEAQRRFLLFGANALKSGPSKLRVWIGILLRNVLNFMMIVLLLAMILSLAIQQWIDAGVLFLVIAVNTVIGVVQEFHSENSLQSLRKLSGTQQCTVVRNGKSNIMVPIERLVVGDLVHVREGDTVPADIRLLKDFDLECDEMLLTGE